HTGVSLTVSRRARCVGYDLRYGSDGSRMTTTTARRTARHLRLWLGVAIAVGVLFMPGLSRTEGFTLSAAALTYVLGATLFDASTVVALAVVVPVLAVLTGRLTAERRRTAVALARLHDALGAAEEQPDLVTTLDSIAASVGHGVRARIAGVVLRDRDQVTVAAWTTGGSAPTPAEAEQLTRAELELGASSPFVAGLSARRRLVVYDFDGD